MRRSKGPCCIEISWEVANPVGGIHTVLATKAEAMLKRWGDNYLVIGPWLGNSDGQSGGGDNPYWLDEEWIKPSELLAGSRANYHGLKLRVGRWRIKGEPQGILIDFSSLWEDKNKLLSRYWELFGLDSLYGAYDYEEPVLFGSASAMVAEALAKLNGYERGAGMIVQAHEWLTGSALLEVRHRLPEAGTVFTTHATALGRSLSSKTEIPAERLSLDQIRHLSLENGVRNKHSMEHVCAQASHVFTTVSEVTARECEAFFGRKPDVVLPNAISPNMPDPQMATPEAKSAIRTYLLELASRTTGYDYKAEVKPPLLMVTAGRYEYRNKGINYVLDALSRARETLKQSSSSKLVLFAMLPADSLPNPPNGDSFEAKVCTHALRNPQHDPILSCMQYHGLRNEPDDPVHVIFVPRYLDGRDPLVPYSYWQLLAGMDLSVFPSWYEPWGYTPMEATALNVPTISTDMAGFAHWAGTFGGPEATGVWILKRDRRPYEESVRDCTELLLKLAQAGPEPLKEYRPALERLASEGRWEHAISQYEKAHDLALARATEKPVRPRPREEIDVAYFSMEFGVNAELTVYSGGLGILAGDHLKAARDLGLKIWGIGLAYQEGYFAQKIAAGFGQQEQPQRHGGFQELGCRRVTGPDGRVLMFDVPAPDGRMVKSAAWRMDLGNTALILLDPNLEENPPELRAISRNLYTGDRDLRWAQEYYLGLGAVMLLEQLGVQPRMYHLNEGHTSLSTFARIAQLKRERYLTMGEALEELRASTLFTTHTPVPAGLERFEWSRVEQGVNNLSNMLRIPADSIKAVGTDPADPAGGFSMTALAMRSANHVNSVAQLHGYVSAALLRPVIDHYPRRRKPPQLLSLTNGVHIPSWASPEWQDLFTKELGKDWLRHLDDVAYWKKLLDVPEANLWHTHMRAKAELLKHLRANFNEKIRTDPNRAEAFRQALQLLDKDPMIISYARRFAAYKRPELLFRDPNRMKAILKQYPNMLFLFAGKAHPADPEGKERIARILSFESMAPFRGHVLFLEDYNITLAKYLVSGSDIWLNVPLQLREASGTSGMKATINGVLNLSTNDGWVYEATHGEVPWVIGKGLETLSPGDQSELHSRELYRLLRYEVAPQFFERDDTGVPLAWATHMRRAISEAMPRFSARRMVREYCSLYDLAPERVTTAEEGASTMQLNSFGP
jgi:starch phosphorylase